MAIKINELRREPEGAMYVAPERLCVTEDGEVCSQEDPRAVRLLVGKGCSIPASEAAQYGLIGSPEIEAPPADEAGAAGEAATEDAEDEKPKRKK